MSIQLLAKIALLVGVLIGITVHECAHAWTANKLGDPTARYLGRVTLNPLAHLDPLGTILMLYSVMIGFGIGWGKPTPVDPRYLKFGPRVGMAIVAIAGPISNIITAVVFAVPLRLAVGADLQLPGYLPCFWSTLFWRTSDWPCSTCFPFHRWTDSACSSEFSARFGPAGPTR